MAIKKRRAGHQLCAGPGESLHLQIRVGVELLGNADRDGDALIDEINPAIAYRLLVAGKTFRYTESGPTGIAGGRKVIVASSRGGLYSPGMPGEHLDFQETYLRGVFGFMGIGDVGFVEGVGLRPDQRATAMRAALASAPATVSELCRKLFKPLASRSFHSNSTVNATAAHRFIHVVSQGLFTAIQPRTQRLVTGSYTAFPGG
jgi:hypothetical protein